MRSLTSWLNLLATFALLGALYTGLDTITHKAANPIFHGTIAFIAIFVTSIALANSMLYSNTLHKEIDELKKAAGKKEENIVSEKK
jgi:hypothetical protein